MKTVLLSLLLAAAPAFAAETDVEVYTASTTGEVVIDTEGRVVEVSLDRKTLGNEVMQAFEDRIRTWRFEPVEQAGKPVRAKSHMALQMEATREKGADGLRLRVESVQFNHPVQRSSDEKMVRTLTRPHYPRDAMERGIGARVDLLLRLDENGQVTDAAALGVRLLGEEIQGSPALHARYFIRAALQAAAGWRIPGVEGGRAVVPVRFSAHGDRGDRWVRTRGIEIEVPAWVANDQASGEVIALGADGGQPSEGWKLLTPLDGA
jgi:hypothetical protein